MATTISFILVLLLVIGVVNGLDFCHYLTLLNSKPLVYSVDNQQLFVFVDQYYWTVTEDKSKLSLTGSETQTDCSTLESRTMKITSNRMDTIFYLETYEYRDDEQYDEVVDSFAFYDNQRQGKPRSFGYMVREGDHFVYDCINGRHSDDVCGRLNAQNSSLKADQIRRSISSPVRNVGTGQMEYVLFLVLEDNRSVVSAKVELIHQNNSGSVAKDVHLIDVNDYNLNPEQQAFSLRLKTHLDSSLTPIGLFISHQSKNRYAFYRFDRVIKYCIIDNVNCLRKSFEVLIDCSGYKTNVTNEPTTVCSNKKVTTDGPTDGNDSPPESSATLYWIIGFVVILFIILSIVGVVLFLWYDQNEDKKPANTPSKETVHTITTIDSKTGEPIEPTLRSERDSDKTREPDSLNS